MNKEFCVICGFKNLFEVTKPKFCAGCGQLLNSSLSATASHQKTVSPKQEDEREFDLEGLDIDQLRKSIAIESHSHKVSLNDLWSAPAPRENFRRPACGESAEGILRKVEKECSTTRVPTEIDG
jgi:hypothetical protein